MTTVAAVTLEQMPLLIDSVEALFAEDSGARDPFVDTGWPRREGVGYYEPMLRDEDCLCLLAWSGGEPAGHLIGRLGRGNSLRPELVAATLESMRVAESARRSGVGSALVTAFVDWAAGLGANRLRVSAYAVNSGALALYQAHGFEPAEVTLQRDL